MDNEYISDTLYHFIGGPVMRDEAIPDGEKDEACYTNLKLVLESNFVAAKTPDGVREYREGVIRVESNTEGHLFNGDFDGFLVKGNITCFCDIPLDSCALHCSKYGKFGIGFCRDELARKGARPVYYFPYSKGSRFSAHELGLIESIDSRIKAFCAVAGDAESDSVLELTERVLTKDFVAFIKPFNWQLPLVHPDNYYTEREWRLLGSVAITPHVVKRIVVARGYKARLRRDRPQLVEYEIYELPD